MFNLPNSLTLMRAPLALLFIIDNTVLRISVVLLAMFTDCIDGYLARRYRHTSQFGAILDPIMDKFFVYVVLAVFLYENKIEAWKASSMLSRDAFLLLFMIYLIAKGMFKKLEVKAIRWGKVTTAFQFLILLGIVVDLPFPFYLYLCFPLFGCLAFIELVQFSKKMVSN
jgi:CDP-diacylglycerol--glycerol-3-phosphate 3-phosphatidyltransferase